MKVIATYLWPTQARVQCRDHNCKFHNDEPVAQIEVDETSIRLDRVIPPRYKVICTVCKEKGNK